MKMNNTTQGYELRLGDLVFHNNYFWIITRIELNSHSSSYDKFTITRKFREDGTFIKSKAKTYTYRDYTKPPDILFDEIIERNMKLSEVYRSIKK